MLNEKTCDETYQRKLKVGDFIVKQNDNEELYVEPLTQHDLADGWKMVLPIKTKKSIKHHFNIYLSQLPWHLWNKVNFNKSVIQDNTSYYLTVCDNNYYYSIKQTKNDGKIRELYNELMNEDYNLTKVKELYTYLLDEHVKGWVMIKASRLLKL
jgi:hypothetical protein